MIRRPPRSTHCISSAASDVYKRQAEKGIAIYETTERCLSEEAPEAYKDIDEVIRLTGEAGLARPVARLRPLIVIKG